MLTMVGFPNVFPCPLLGEQHPLGALAVPSSDCSWLLQFSLSALSAAHLLPARSLQYLGLHPALWAAPIFHCSYNLSVNSRQGQICREIATFCRKLVFHYEAINHWNIVEIAALAVHAICATVLTKALVPETQNTGHLEDRSAISALVVPYICQGSKGR